MLTRSANKKAMSLLRTIVQLFNPVESVSVPFDTKYDVVVVPEEKKPTELNVESVNWGPQKRTAIVTVNNAKSFIDWNPTKNGNGRKSIPEEMELDKFDRAVIKQHGQKEKDWILLKPFIVAGWTYPEITDVIEFSQSWIERRGPKIKKAIILRKRAAANPSPQ